MSLTSSTDHPSPKQPSDSASLDVLVIGAGQAGLAVAWHLARGNLRFLVLDAGPEVGHSWRNRWDSLTLFTPAEYSSLPGLPFPAPAGTYPTKDEVTDYLRTYADTFALPVLPNTRVTRLTRSEGGGLFEVHTEQGSLFARSVVVATGAFQQPVIPELAVGLDPEVAQLHSSQYRNPADLPAGPVLVVGGGNSGLQIALELAKTLEVHLAMGSKQPMVPQRPLGRDLFWWLTRLGLLTRPVDSRVTQLLRRRGGDLVIGTNRAMLRTAGVRLRPRAVGADRRTVTFADDTSLEVAAVLWATGFRADYSWIDIPGVWDGRQVDHRRGISAVPGLSFIGLPWQHTRGSALLGFVEDDAQWLAEHITVRARNLAILPARAVAARS